MYKKDVTTIANALVSNEGVNRGEAFRKSHLIAELKSLLRVNHIVTFRYMKKDGSIRIARGTLHPVILEKYVKGTYTGRERHDVMKYFDLDKNSFRSFKGMYLIDIL